MKCPSCGNKAIGLWDWAKGTRWFRTTCDSCGHALKASTRTWLGFAAAFLWGVGAAVAYELAVEKGPISMVIAMGVFVVIGIATYYTIGGYELDKKSRSKKPGSP
jgi:hypothetical protein